MGETLDFNDWLVRPGNHRAIVTIRKDVKSALGMDANIRSWLDLYRLFEFAVAQTEDAVSWFENVMRANPPSPENGATLNQVLLYRGAYVNKEALAARPANARVSKTKTVTYRGQVVETSLDGPDRPAEPQPAASAKKKRYYRGVLIED
ncbi:hypothetical protein [Pseudomaricurvus sp. HS19]|uniref:hypothetical protein n=1 Tax=Pseudomaricurvus sp. HS19 TaxID=2692626 RepID=UPI001371A347|nr:hypothetical protein [Pseudomaricurvus sp. HS19]MYM63013.1 hypothetical protein [Pseudomaricurvus sp. HS19]